MTLTDPKAYTEPWISEKMILTRAEPNTKMREDVCVPSVEQKYKEMIRNPAGGASSLLLLGSAGALWQAGRPQAAA